MPVRTINYTNRKRIRREDVRITLREEKDRISFDASLRFAHYQLTPEAHVYVEAYRQTQYMRFDYGSVGLLSIPADRSLRSFDSAEGVLFRVKIVTVADPRGMLLAEADQIRPRKSTDEDENRIPLLPVVPNDNMGDEIWRLEIDDPQTLLLVNSALGDWRAMARDPGFISLVYPFVFRSLLWRILHQERYFEIEETEDWRSRWLRFATGLPGVSDLPVDEETRLDEWIENAVSAFCRRNNLRATYERYWTGAQSQ